MGVLSGNEEETGTMNQLNCIIGNLDSGHITVIAKTGAGLWDLKAANTYGSPNPAAFGTNVNAGALSLDNASGAGISAINVAQGAMLTFALAPMTVANNVTLNGITTGLPLTVACNGALCGNNRAGGNQNTLSGTLTLNANSNISTSWNDKSLVITGPVVGPGDGLQIDIFNTASQPTNVSLLNSNNTYGGATIVNNATLAIGGTNGSVSAGNPTGALSPTTSVTVSTTGNLNFLRTDVPLTIATPILNLGTLNINAGAPSFSALSTSSTGTVNVGGVAGKATLTVLSWTDHRRRHLPHQRRQRQQCRRQPHRRHGECPHQRRQRDFQRQRRRVHHVELLQPQRRHVQHAFGRERISRFSSRRSRPPRPSLRSPAARSITPDNS